MKYLLFACRFQNGGNMIFLLYYINVNQSSSPQLYSKNSKELFSFQKETMGANFHEEKRTKTKFATIEAEYNLKNYAH